MADFLEKLEERVRSLNKNMAPLSESREIVDKTRAIADLVQAQNLSSKKDAAKLPTKAVTDLEPSEIPQLFFLAHDEPTDRELCLTDGKIVSVSTHLGILDISMLGACMLQWMAYAGDTI